MIGTFRFPTTRIAQALLVILTVQIPSACGEEPHEKAPDKLRLSVDSVHAPTALRLKSSVLWKGREYDINSGINIIMDVVRDSEQSTHERELALVQLAMLRTQLKGHPCLDDLATLYNHGGALEKQLILICFLGSRDSRAIPLFTSVLENQDNMKLRLPAASGLAGWNVRRGVAELVHLLKSKEILPEPSRIPLVCDNAMESFEELNARKGWGFPDEMIRKPIESRPGLDREEFVALYTAEIKKWFAENEHRFPDWKPGDPLPEVAAPEKRIPAEKRAEDK